MNPFIPGMNIHLVSFDIPLKYYFEFLKLAGKSVHKIEEPLGYLKGRCKLKFISNFMSDTLH